jgi:phosphatidylglycerol---prolipoprotein diacylglyceryl transferase
VHDDHPGARLREPIASVTWWILGLVMFTGPWPRALPAGSAALAVLAWYGAGRFFLEPLRETPDVVCGRVRINQVVAALIAVGAGGALALLIRG